MSDPQSTRSFLSDLLDRLEKAERIYAADRLSVCQLRSVRRRIADVRRYQADMDRDPEFHAPLVNGFLGPNGWGALIDDLCREADRLAGRSSRPCSAPG